MKCLLILVILLNFSFNLVAQKSTNYKSIPSFNGCNFKNSASNKIQEIKDRTQLFISKRIPEDFLKSISNINDTIIFSYKYTVNKKGIVIPAQTQVYTNSSSFTSKIKKVLNELPHFSPPKSRGRRKSYDFIVNEIAEFHVDSLHKLTPIYRKGTNKTLNITTSNKKITELYRKINKHKIVKWPISNIVHFSLSESKNIDNIRVITKHSSAENFVKSKIKKLDSIKPSLFDSLTPKSNYSIKLDLYIERK